MGEDEDAYESSHTRVVSAGHIHPDPLYRPAPDASRTWTGPSVCSATPATTPTCALCRVLKITELLKPFASRSSLKASGCCCPRRRSPRPAPVRPLQVGHVSPCRAPQRVRAPSAGRPCRLRVRQAGTGHGRNGQAPRLVPPRGCRLDCRLKCRC